MFETYAAAYRYLEQHATIWHSVRKGYWRVTCNGRKWYGQTKERAMSEGATSLMQAGLSNITKD